MNRQGNLRGWFKTSGPSVGIFFGRRIESDFEDGRILLTKVTVFHLFLVKWEYIFVRRTPHIPKQS